MKRVMAIFSIFLLFPHGTSGYLFASMSNSPAQKPTFQEIYENYSFIESTELSEKFSYPKKEIEKERKRLRKEKENKLRELYREYQTARKELSKYQEQQKKLSSDIDKIERSDPNFKENQKHQELVDKREEVRCKILEWGIKSDKQDYQLKKDSEERYYNVLEAQLDLL